jgi:flagellin-like hook-associated protein FlgL
MSAIPSNLSRAPNILIAQGALSTITRTNLSLFQVQEQMASGRAINRFSDDSVKAASISILDDRLDRIEQRRRNLQHADGSLSALDTALGEANDLVLEARDIASAQVGLGSSAEERESQAAVIDSLIQGLFGIANRQSLAGHIFGGSQPGTKPIEHMLGGYRYVARGNGLLTDLGIGSSIPITLGAGSAIGSTSSRVEGTEDLDPALTPETRIADLGGARGLGIQLGVVEFSFDGGPRTQIDLAGAETVQAVTDRITQAIEAYETANGVTVLGPGGVSMSGGSLSIDVAAGGPPNPQLQFFDTSAGVIAQDLGLTGIAFQSGTSLSTDLRPRLTWDTPISALDGVTGALGQIRIRNLGQSRTIDLSTATTIEDIRNLIEGTDLGLRVEINADGTAFNVLNEVAAGRTQALSIEEVSGQGLTATRLGIRSLSADTRIADFNDGRGVQIVDGGTDPVTGLPDPARDVDFTIELGDGREITVDLRPQDMTTVQAVLDRINAQAVAAGVNVPTDFEARLGDDANGILLTQNAGFGTVLTVQANNNSLAAEQLGLATLANDGSGVFRSEDRATVRVDNLFTTLIDLRDALRNDDTIGITLAGERLEASTERIAQTRATVGAYAQRVEDGGQQLDDQELLDMRIRSELRDLDYTEAAVRLNLLQMQLQAGLHVTAQSFSRSLLDFLG